MLYVISVLLSKHDTSKGTVTATHTLHWREADSEDEARGNAIATAMASKPGFSVVDVLCSAVEQPDCAHGDINESALIARIANLEAQVSELEKFRLERIGEPPLVEVDAENTRLRTELGVSRARVKRLERFICHEGGLVNEWAHRCPCGTKLTDHMLGTLNHYLKLNP